MKRIASLLAVVGLLAAGAAAWYLQRPKPVGLEADGQRAAAGPGGPAASGARGPGGPGGAGGPGGPGGAGGGPAPVEVGKAVSQKLVDDVQAVGTVRARRSVVLKPEVSGRIAQLLFSDGARVRKGQLLVQLDDTLPQAQLKQAEAQATIARTNLQRSRDLAAQNFVSQSAVDQNAAALEVALAQVALAQAQVSRMRILAPFDAVAGIRSAHVGDYLKDGADIVTLDETSAVVLDFRLPERYVPRVKPGQALQVQADALPGRSFGAVVVALDSQVEANGRALLVRAEVRNAEGILRPGMFARAQLLFGTRDNAVLVPEEALVPLGGKQFVFKVVPGGKGPVAQKIEAQVGLRVPGKVELLGGIVAGDTVVTAGHARLLRGDNLPVRVIDLDKPAGPRGAAGGAGGGPGAASGARGAGSAPAAGPGGAASAGRPASPEAAGAASGPASAARAASRP